MTSNMKIEGVKFRLKTLYLRHQYLVVCSVKDWRIVIDILDGDGDGADIFQGRLPAVAGLHCHVYLLLPVRFVTIEHLNKK